MEVADELLEQAKNILKQNDKDGHHTIPANGLYPHQWLWDSCFIAIGLSNYDLKRAQTEILTLLKGQWSNGMVPHMIFDNGATHRQDRNMWRSWVSPYAPGHVATTGITQPPVLAEAVVRIGDHMRKPERRSWYQKVYPKLLKHHLWLYEERDPHKEGLALQVHPWETGLDDTPPWMYELHKHQLSWWIRAVEKFHLEPLINFFRRDARRVPPSQRLDAVDALALYSVQRRLRRKAYDIDAILSHSLFAIEDVGFNAIMIRANTLLVQIAKAIGEKVPQELLDKMKQSEAAFESLWDDRTKQYYSRSFITHDLIAIPTIGTLLPLYAGSISQERADELVKHLTNKKEFGTKYPVPSAPLNSDWFHELGYWQGPTWINTNWLIMDGLRRYGYDELANKIWWSSLELVTKSGFYEYFSPISGEPAGIANFSWTAALTIDLLNHPPKAKKA